MKFNDLFDTLITELPQARGLVKIEAELIYNVVKSLQDIDGDMVEIGVWHGFTSKIICENKGDKPLHLFDLFDQFILPRSNNAFRSDNYKVELNNVKKYLKKYNNVFFYKGDVVDNLKYLNGLKFSFVNIDVDIYAPTIISLNYFYDKIVSGGYIVIHDYLSIDEIDKAINEFVQKNNILPTQVNCNQCIFHKQ